jgi:hypothetical protein
MLMSTRSDRCWNYYLCYCEAAFDSKTEGVVILVFSRPGNMNLIDLRSAPMVTSNLLDHPALPPAM